MKKVNSLIFFDMDGTLLSSKSTIVPEVRDAVRQLKKNGNIPVICTGRAAFEVRHFMRECQIDAIVSMNGQYLEFGGQVIASREIPKQLCAEVLKYAQSRNDILGFYNYQQIALSEDQSLARSFYQNIASPFPQVADKFYQNNPVNQLLVISHHADRDYGKNFPELEFFITGKNSIDTVLKGGSKGEGIKKLQEIEQLTVPTYAFGDGNNDLTMFDVVDYSIAMANGNAAIKAKADYITDTNDNLGIVKALQKLDLI